MDSRAGSVNLRDKFVSEEEVRLLGARIDIDLDCSGGTFKNSEGDALSLDRVKVGGNMLLRNEFFRQRRSSFARGEHCRKLGLCGGTFFSSPSGRRGKGTRWTVNA